jgi:hypothetical protein
MLILLSNSTKAQNRVFVCAGSKLFSVDAENCIADFKGSSTYFSDIAFTTDGRLWGINQYGSIYKIDTLNADTTFMFKTDLYSSSLEGLNESNLLAISGESLYKIDLISGNTLNLGYIGYTPSGDMTWYDDYLYLNASSLMRIHLDTLSLKVNEVKKVGWHSYKGLDGYGLAVDKFIDSTKVMLVFDKYDMYAVCQIDGSTRLKCTKLIDMWASGAAHLRYAKQDPIPEICYQVLNPTEDIQFFINHLNKVITIYSSEEFSNLDISLFSMSGQKIRNYSKLSGTEFSFNIDNIAHGLYILKIINGSNIQSEKIILN